MRSAFSLLVPWIVYPISCQTLPAGIGCYDKAINREWLGVENMCDPLEKVFRYMLQQVVCCKQGMRMGVWVIWSCKRGEDLKLA